MDTAEKSELQRVNFPADFIWGTATASYQIEGAVAVDGRKPSVWDVFSHTPGKIDNGDTGDVACDHYHRYKQDVALMRNLGLNSYRFSVSWSRILPEGTGHVNQAGLDFYSRLVDELLENDIQPFATIFHWDLPQILQEKGGWSNRDTAFYFAEYADKISRSLGDRVKGWITHNEPGVYSALGHLTGQHAPGLKDLNTSVRVAHHLLLGHGLALPMLRQNAARQDAEFGITLNFNAVDPGDDKAVEFAVIEDAWVNRMFLDPLVKGVYPKQISEIIDKHLPIEPGDMEIITAPIDFLGVNYYFRTLPIAWKDRNLLTFESRHNDEAEYTAVGWEVYPEGLYKLLCSLHEDYKVSKIYITENGAAYHDVLEGTQENPVVHDAHRLHFIQQHLEMALKAVHEGVPLAGYFVWSLLDNFEWGYGYDKRFGLTYVDYPTQRRILKDSGLWYRDFLHK